MEHSCYHCGLKFSYRPQLLSSRTFCCQGCASVYSILYQHQLEKYYQLESTPGNTPKENASHYDLWDDAKLKQSCVLFRDNAVEIVLLHIPNIHCSSCIWVLEQLDIFMEGISSVEVFFAQKTIQITYQHAELKLSAIAKQLNALGYAPILKPNSSSSKASKRLWYQFGIAGFAFGNSMFLAFPSYFEVGEFWLIQYQPFFDFIQLFFSIPVVLYSAQDYFVGAWKSLINKRLSLDFPLALGIAALFAKSVSTLFYESELAYFDSLNGLVFFLLLGKYIQQNIYQNFHFERDFHDFFPVGVTRIGVNGNANVVALESIKVDDMIYLRQGEIIPADGSLASNAVNIDYSFVSGESKPTLKEKNESVFAGGRVLNSCELRVTKPNRQSFLIQLWKQQGANQNKKHSLEGFNSLLSRMFTPIILVLAAIGGGYAYFRNPETIVETVTAILIVACPCALALSTPFVMGNLLRYFAREKFYVKNIQVAERLSKITHIVFDKTGTLTWPDSNAISYHGKKLTQEETDNLSEILKSSLHPLSQTLYRHLSYSDMDKKFTTEEFIGKGIKATFKSETYLIGTASFTESIAENINNSTNVHININQNYRGYFSIRSHFRNGLKSLFEQLKSYSIHVVSGDNDSDKEALIQLGIHPLRIHFNRDPFHKIDFIKSLQSNNNKALMLGDGLNDSGALQQSDIGIALSQDRGIFTPACDAIMLPKALKKLGDFIKMSRGSKRLIYVCFIISLIYNTIGLSYAFQGLLTPIVAAILMPLSSISIFFIATIGVKLLVFFNKYF